MLPTVKVVCEVRNQDGQPLVGASVLALLDQTEVFDGFVVPKLTSGGTDAQGRCELALWPNALGANASAYTVSVFAPKTGKQLFSYRAVVPNSDSLLENIIVQAPFPEVDAAQQALIAAQGALAPVTAQAAAAAASALVAQDAEDGALAAETAAQASATAALASEQAAAASQSSAGGSATTASAAAVTATAAAGVAQAARDAAQVGSATATAQAEAATLSAQAADASANASATSAAAAGVSANAAQTQAVAAAASAGSALAQAEAAQQSKSAAQTAASAAQASEQQAGDAEAMATTQAAFAAVSAATAGDHAGAATAQAAIATTKASEAATSAALASSKATEASTSAAAAATDRAQTGLDRAATAASEAAALQARNDAQAWAASPEDQEITEGSGDYSALHWAAKSVTSQGIAGAFASTAVDAAQAAGQALADAVAVVTGGTASLTAEAGKLPIAGASGVLDETWTNPIPGVNAAALHRSPNAVTAMFVYDTSKDSDGGAWTEKCQHTSWYNEPIQDKWLGAQPSELNARNEGAVLGDELLPDPDLNSTTGIATSTVRYTVTGGKAIRENNANAASLRFEGSFTAGKTYRVAVAVANTPPAFVASASAVFSVDVFNQGQVANATTGVQAGGLGSTLVFYITPTVTCNRLGVNNSTNTYADIEAVSVREVSAQTTQSGDYFQLATDGRFYRLNAGSGTTEVFRGNKRDFPRLAAIVAEAGNVTIYDLTEPGRPMWMRYHRPSVGSGIIGWEGGAGPVVSSIFALNGTVCIGGNAAAVGLVLNNFSLDKMAVGASSGKGLSSNRAISNRNGATSTFGLVLGSGDYSIANTAVNAVAMTVLPDAPHDPATGLKVPTIAVATAGGVSVIKHNGAVVTAGSGVQYKVQASGRRFYCIGITPNAWAGEWYFELNSLGQVVAPTAYNNGGPIKWQTGSGYANGNALTVANKLKILQGDGGQVGLLCDSPGSMSKGSVAYLRNTYNTGHMTGDIRRAYLADAGTGSVTGPELVTNGTFDVDVSGWAADSGVTLSVVDGRMYVLSTDAYKGVTTSITTVVGKVYRLSRFVKGGTGTLRFRTVINGVEVGGSTNIDNGYEATETFLFAATSTTTYIRFQSWNTISNFYLDNISVREVVADRSYKAQGANITGTLNKNEVASAAQLAAYSGFSASNYLREPYSADLDFGTSEWSVGAWVNTGALSSGINLLPNSGASSGNGMGGGRTITRAAFTDSATGIVADLLTATGGSTGCGADIYVPLVPGVPYTFSAYLGLPADSALSTLTVGIYGYWPSYTAVTVPKGSLSRVSITVTIPNTAAGIAAWQIALNTYGGRFSIWGVGSSANMDKLYFAQLQLEVGSAFSTYRATTTLPLVVTERAFSSGPYVRLALTHDYKLTATAFDGTNPARTVTTTAAYNTGTWIKAEADYTTDGTLSISVNGVEVAATRGNPLLTLNNSNAVLTIGNSYNLDAPFPGSIALLKLSATVPTAEQAVWMYEQEKQLFRAGAQCCLPDSGAILDLTYDDATDKWIAVSAANESEWAGLVRTSVTPAPAGSYTRVTASSGVQLLARSTNNPGVDVTIPAYGLREELVKRAEAAARLNAQLATYDYVGGFTANTTTGNTAILNAAGITYPVSIVGARVSGSGIPANTTVVAVSGTTIYLSAAATATATGVQISFVDFILPVGMEAKEVSLAGAAQREGATAQFTRLFDGFKETIRFGTAPSHTSHVQIQAARSAA